MIPLVLLTQFGAPATRPHNSIPQPNNLYSLCVGGGWAGDIPASVGNLERKRDYLLSSVSGRMQCIPAHKNTIPKCYAIIQAEVQMVYAIVSHPRLPLFQPTGLSILQCQSHPSLVIIWTIPEYHAQKHHYELALLPGPVPMYLH